MTVSPQKLIIAIDFDGVVHRGKKPWTNAHEINDDVVPGALQFIRDAMDADYRVVLHTSRALTVSSVPHINSWLERQGLEERYRWHVEVSALKTDAHVYIDDKAMRFEGVFPTIEQLKALKSWDADDEPVRAPEDEGKCIYCGVVMDGSRAHEAPNGCVKAYAEKLKEMQRSRDVFCKGFEAQMNAVEIAIKRTLVCEGEKQTYRDILRGLVQAIDGGSSSTVNLELERARALLATEA